MDLYMDLAYRISFPNFKIQLSFLLQSQFKAQAKFSFKKIFIEQAIVLVTYMDLVC